MSDWTHLPLLVKWGPYTRLDADEQAKIVDLSIKAQQAGLVTRKMAVGKIGSVFGIEDVNLILEGLEEEDEKNAASELTKTMNEQKAMHAIATAQRKPSRGQSEEDS